MSTDAHKRARSILDCCIKQGLVNPVTGEGSPTETMLAEELLCVENNTSPESDELAAYVRRLARIVRKHDPDNAVAASAVRFLACTGHIKTMRKEGA